MRYLMMLLILILGAACTVETSQGNEDAMRLETNKKGWSASGTLTHRGQKEVSCQADFYENPGNYTAQFKVSGDLRNKKVIAEITWSVEGNQNRRIVSVADGTSVQGAGQGVSIKIRDASTQNLSPGWDTDYIASVTIVKGSRGSTANPPTFDAGDPVVIADANLATVQVPQNAGIISVGVLLATGIPGTPIAENSVMVIQMDAGGNMQSRYDPRQFFWVPLFPGVDHLNIVNNSGADCIASVIFGVEG